MVFLWRKQVPAVVFYGEKVPQGVFMEKNPQVVKFQTMDPQVEIKETPTTYLVVIKADKVQTFEVSKNFGLTLLKRLILMKYPTAVYKTTPAMDYGENFHSGAKK